MWTFLCSIPAPKYVAEHGQVRCEGNIWREECLGDMRPHLRNRSQTYHLQSNIKQILNE